MCNLTYLPKYPYAHKWIKNSNNPHKSCLQGIQVRVRITKSHRQIMSSLESNCEIDSTSYYRESIIES